VNLYDLVIHISTISERHVCNYNFTIIHIKIDIKMRETVNVKYYLITSFSLVVYDLDKLLVFNEVSRNHSREAYSSSISPDGNGTL
jgi:hypothetical protein